MRTTLEILDAFKRRLSITSDYQAADELGVTRQTVSGWRHGTHFMNPFTATVAAEKMGESKLKLIAIVEAERTKRPHEKKYWQELAKASIFATAMIGGGIFGMPSTASADGYSNGEMTSVYIMRRRRRGRFYDNLPKDPVLAGHA